MMKYVTVTRTEDLSEIKWTFLYFEDRYTMFLDSYYESSRPSKRHKFVTDKVYMRTGPYGINATRIPEELVPLPEDVMMEAREIFFRDLESKFKISKWGSR